MVVVSHELVSTYESNFRIISIHHMNQNFLFHMDDTHHMKTNICKIIVKIIVFDEEKNHVKHYFLVGSHGFTRIFLFLFDYCPIGVCMVWPKPDKPAEPNQFCRFDRFSHHYSGRWFAFFINL